MGDDHNAAHNAPLLALIASGDRRYREYIVRSVASRYRLWLLEAHEPTWQRPYLAGSSLVDVRDPHALIVAARAVPPDHGPLAGVFCYDEWTIEAAAVLAQTLSLPTSPPSAVAACRDKAATRQRLADAGLPQPQSFPVASLDQTTAAADKIGYPVVVKARALAGSIGVVRVDTVDDLHTAYTAAAVDFPGVPRQDAGVLVEEYLDGPEISIDSAVIDGSVTPIAVAHKTVGLHPYFEETAHVVDATDPLLRDPELREYLTAAHRAVGFRHGMTHTEVRFTRDGPRIVEVNARLGGDFIPYLGHLATGVDLGLVAADIAAGRTPAIIPTLRRAASIRFLYPLEDCVVDEVVVHADRFTAHTHQAIATAIRGQQLRLPPAGFLARYGHVIGVADTAEQARAATADAERIVELRYTPLARQQSQRTNGEAR
jgi:biotin carboxylase